MTGGAGRGLTVTGTGKIELVQLPVDALKDIMAVPLPDEGATRIGPLPDGIPLNVPVVVTDQDKVAKVGTRAGAKRMVSPSQNGAGFARLTVGSGFTNTV
jgi:hypothetical protein